ncbi:Gfo/Idh/MocA family oxidoreductase [Celerinatantimonas sp. MCCC 1A17872]|uniref:Gfo/Idh/MocA family oxidoreductase n=1 Tax=Celerinatantimonas sp. MCCC 1A17872 TaxID=3177514 RepID=UPI0038BEC013
MRIGLVGYGDGGRYFHAPFICAAENVELAAIVARSESKIKAIHSDYPNVPVYSSLAEMTASESLDAVTISTPPHTRRELVLEAIGAGLHVVADKPFAPNAEVGREMANAAKEKGVLLGAFHNRRWDSDVQTLRQVLAQNKLGKIWRMHSRLDCDDPLSLEAGPNGGLLRDLGSHVVDQAYYLLGPVSAVYAHLDEIEMTQGPTNASFVLTLTHASGATSYVSASKINRIAAKEFIVYGEKGSYYSSATDVQAEALFAGKRPIDDPQGWGYEQPSHLPVLRTQEGEQTVASVPGRYHDYYSQFAKAVTGEGDLPVSAEQAIEILKILDAAIESARLNQVVKI